MKKQVRFGVFETNSSSTHSLTMMMKSDYDEWKNSGKYLCTNAFSFRNLENKPVDGSIYSKDEVKGFLSALFPDEDFSNDDLFEDFRKDYCFELFDEDDESYLESFYEEYTTPNGDVVVAFGEYGFDG